MHFHILNPHLSDIGNAMCLLTSLAGSGIKTDDVHSGIAESNKDDIELVNLTSAYGGQRRREPCHSRQASGESVARSVHDRKLQKASEAVWKEFW